MTTGGDYGRGRLALLVLALLSTVATRPASPDAPSNSWNAKVTVSPSTARHERVPVPPGIF